MRKKESKNNWLMKLKNNMLILKSKDIRIIKIIKISKIIKINKNKKTI